MLPLNNGVLASGGTGETFPLLNAVFFEEGVTTIPSRYTALHPNEAMAFTEASLVSTSPVYLDNQRSVRQLNVYHNILNVVASRLQKNQSAVTLTGFGYTHAEGHAMASSIQEYFSQRFAIDASRIRILSAVETVRTSDPMLKAAQRRVVITSADETLLQQVGGGNIVAAGETQKGNARFSVLFEFDQSLTVTENEQFLLKKVVPLISNDATVIIHGHTDYAGNDKHNLLLSGDRARGIQQLLERAVAGAGKTHVRFEAYGFGEIPGITPFRNRWPEEAYYNRTVTIDIIPLQ